MYTHHLIRDFMFLDATTANQAASGPPAAVTPQVEQQFTVRFLALNPADFVGNPRHTAETTKQHSTRDPLHAISGVLRSDPNLPPEAARALEDIIHVAYDELKRTPA